MEQSFESRTGEVPYTGKEIYGFLSDFNHFEHLLPEGQVNGWKTDGESCRFEAPGVGEVGLKIIEKIPHEFIEIVGDNSAKIPFNLQINISDPGRGQSQVKLTIRAKLSPFIRVVAEKPLRQFLDILINHIESFDFSKGLP